VADDEQVEMAEIMGDAPSSSELSGAAAPAGRLLGRAETARLLGVSKSTLRRMEGEQLEPVVGPKNVRLFQEEQVQALVITRRSSTTGARATGDIAADAFDMFDKDVHPVDVVKRLRIAPDLVEMLHQQWARLRGLLVLSQETTTSICDMLGEGEARSLPKSDADLLGFTKKWVQDASTRVCVQCTGEPAEFCRDCAKSWGRRAARNEIAEQRTRRL